MILSILQSYLIICGAMTVLLSFALFMKWLDRILT